MRNKVVQWRCSQRGRRSDVEDDFPATEDGAEGGEELGDDEQAAGPGGDDA